MDDGIEARPPVQPSPGLHNADLTPVLPGERTWGEHDMASLWIGLVVSVSSWWVRCEACVAGRAGCCTDAPAAEPVLPAAAPTPWPLW